MTVLEEKAIALADKAEELMSATDDEMGHGHYGTPDAVPPGHEDEDDYYLEHEKIVSAVVDLRGEVSALIADIRRCANG